MYLKESDYEKNKDIYYLGVLLNEIFKNEYKSQDATEFINLLLI
jgi:hypothetical protein